MFIEDAINNAIKSTDLSGIKSVNEGFERIVGQALSSMPEIEDDDYLYTKEKIETNDKAICRVQETLEENEAAIIDGRRSECSCCGRKGIHVDTESGEIFDGGDIIASVTDSERYLMTDDRDGIGNLYCDDCHEFKEEWQEECSESAEACKDASDLIEDDSDWDHKEAAEARSATEWHTWEFTTWSASAEMFDDMADDWEEHCPEWEDNNQPTNEDILIAAERGEVSWEKKQSEIHGLHRPLIGETIIYVHIGEKKWAIAEISEEHISMRVEGSPLTVDGDPICEADIYGDGDIIDEIRDEISNKIRVKWLEQCEDLRSDKEAEFSIDEWPLSLVEWFLSWMNIHWENFAQFIEENPDSGTAVATQEWTDTDDIHDAIECLRNDYSPHTLGDFINKWVDEEDVETFVAWLVRNVIK